MKTRKLLIPVAAVAALGAALLPTGVAAKRGDVRVNGTCTGSSSVKLKASPDNGRIETELEVDQNVNGQRWKVRLKSNGKVVKRTTARTKAPSGSFEVKRRLPDRSGTDRIKGIAKNKKTGERCRASLSI